MCCWQWILHVGSGWNWCICPSLKVSDQESPWFSAASAAAIVHRNHVFHFYQKDKSSESKVRFKQASKFCKRVLQAAKLAYANKAKESITSQKLGFQDFWQIANNVLSKGKSAIPALLDGLEVSPSASEKAKLFGENFSKNSNLDDSCISLPIFPSRTNLKLHNISNSQGGWKGHNEPWFAKGIWSWLHSSGGSKELWA